jgi:large subunit ribosomal protein L4
MPKIDVYNIEGKKVSDIELNENVFGIKPNEKIVHIALVNYMANQRQGTANTKTRAEVAGGGRKPWRQKGTGRARQGSIRAPQWIKGGIALGPKPRDYSYRINKKERQLAIRSVLSSKVIEKELPDAEKETLMVIDSTTGQNAIIQVKAFKEVVPITGLVLTKLDGTAKGGVVIGIVNENSIPVKFVGVGEKIDDMEVFNSKDFVDAII